VKEDGRALDSSSGGEAFDNIIKKKEHESFAREMNEYPSKSGDEGRLRAIQEFHLRENLHKGGLISLPAFLE